MWGKIPLTYLEEVFFFLIVIHANYLTFFELLLEFQFRSTIGGNIFFLNLLDATEIRCIIRGYEFVLYAIIHEVKHLWGKIPLTYLEEVFFFFF